MAASTIALLGSTALAVVGVCFALFTKTVDRWSRLLICVLLADIVITVPVAAWEVSPTLASDAANYATALMAIAGTTLFDVVAMAFFESRIELFFEFAQSAAVDGALLGRLYVFVVQVLYVATPALIAYNAYAFITRSFSQVRIRHQIAKAMRRSDPVYLFNGINDRSMLFVKSLFSHESKPDRDEPRLCVFAGVSKDDREKRSSDMEDLYGTPVFYTELSLIELTNYLNASKSTALSRMSSLHVFFFGNDESSNLSDTLQFVELLVKIVPTERADDGDPRFDPARFEGEVVTAEIARACFETRSRFNGGVPRYHVYCACRGRSDELTLDSIPDARGIDIRVIDEAREALYDLLWHYPLHSVLRPPVRKALCAGASDELEDLVAIVIGCGHYGFEAIRACSWLGQIPGCRLSVHVIDKANPDDFASWLRHWCPGLFDEPLVDIYFHSARIDSPAFGEALQLVRDGGAISITENPSGSTVARPIAPNSIPYCIIAAGDDDENTDTAISLRRFFYGNGEGPVIEPKVFINIYDEKRHSVVKNLRAADTRGSLPFMFEPFGGVAHIFSKDYLINPDLEALAFNVNASYEGMLDDSLLDRMRAIAGSGRGASGASGQPDALAQLRQYLFLRYSSWQMNRLSSITNSIALRTKIWLLGFDLSDKAAPETATPDERAARLGQGALGQLDRAANAEDTDSKALIGAIARAEHNRWMAFYFGEGWLGEDAAASNLFKDLGLSNGRHDSHLLMRHPYLCPYDDLPEIAAALGKDDPTKHDKDFVRNLAKIISDAGGYTGKRFDVKPLRDDDAAVSGTSISGNPS